MASGGIEKLAAQIAEASAIKVRVFEELWSKAIESPIERLFLIGVIGCIENECVSYFDSYALQNGQGASGGVWPKAADYPGALLISYQLTLMDWRADFVLSSPWASNRSLIVECDGHDFHERTKEQAARDRSRDRAAVAAGHRIIRFTGSELYRDPLGCAREALKQAKWLCE